MSRCSLLPLLALLACGPDKELLTEKQQLETQVSDLEKDKARLGKAVAIQRKRVEDLEKQLKAQLDQGVWESLGIPKSGTISATIQTSMGTIRCELWPKVAPATVLNFVQLAEGTREWQDPRTGKKVTRPLYDGALFHRVVPDFMIQGGDPLGTGAGDPGYRFDDEIDPSVTFDRKGLLAMANVGPNTNGSQFFITDGVPSHLNGKHTIFGDCSRDTSVVSAIAALPRDKQDRPSNPPVMKKITISRGR